MTTVFRTKSRMTGNRHVRFGNGGGAGDRPADRDLGGYELKPRLIA
jgi:hypothetical protein